MQEKKYKMAYTVGIVTLDSFIMASKYYNHMFAFRRKKMGND